MKVILHIGAHRTGTTALQAWLLENEQALAGAGIAAWGPERTRAGLLAGLVKRPELVTPGDVARARVSAARLRMEIDRLADRGFAALVISEENVLGAMPQCLDHLTLYPDARGRFDRLAEALGPRLTGVALSVRRYDEWWASVIGAQVARGQAAPGAAALARIVNNRRGWRQVIGATADAFGVPVTVWSYETLAGDHAGQLAAMLPGQRLPSDLWESDRRRNAHIGAAMGPGGPRLARDAGAPTRPVPFDDVQRAALVARYLDDIAWLRAAQRDEENDEIQIAGPGTNPAAPTAEEGSYHDRQARGMA